MSFESVRIEGSLDQWPDLGLYQGVRDPELLQKHGTFLAEGRLVVERVVKSWPERVQSLLVTRTAERTLRPLLEGLPPGIPVYEATVSQLEGLTGHRFHRGCLALVKRPPARSWNALVPGARRLLLAEGVGNPDNMGSLFRNALAFGVDAVLLSHECVDPLYRKAIRTSVGAVLRVPYARLPGARELGLAGPNLLPVLTMLKERGIRTVALSTASAARPLLESVSRLRLQRLALVVGAEGPGLSQETLAGCAELLRVDMCPGIDSLNLAVASGIVLHALMPCASEHHASTARGGA